MNDTPSPAPLIACPADMLQYVGTKTIFARRMDRGEYCSMRGWTVPEDENAADAGYMVMYTDGGRANVDGYAGYVSWSPADVFEAAYHLSTIPPMHESQAFKTLPETTGGAGATLATPTPYLYPHDVAIIYHDAYQALAIQSGNLSVPKWFQTTPEYQTEIITAVEILLSEAGGAVASIEDAKMDAAASYLFVGVCGALKPFVITTP
jgi:hypothetical protein